MTHDLSVRAMFDRIAPTYDLLNRVMSVGRDQAWRERAVSVLNASAPPGPILDLCAGTLDLTHLVSRARPSAKVTACDFGLIQSNPTRTSLTRSTPEQS